VLLENIRGIKCDQSRKRVVKEVACVGDEKCTAVTIFGSIQWKWPEHGMFPWGKFNTEL
jgi:hypothetical protein